MIRAWGLAGATALLLAGVACDRTPSPEASLRSFIAAAARGDHDRAWAGLCAETRAAADALVEETRVEVEAAGARAPKDGKELLFGRGGLEMVREVETIEERARSDDRARLRIVDPKGEAVEVEMRREAGHWCLHLPLR